MAANPDDDGGSEGAPPPARAPLGCLAAGVLVAGMLAMVLGAGAMVFGMAPVLFLIPLVLIACFFVAQVLVTRVLRLPVRGPAEPMGGPGDDAPPAA